MTHSEGSSPGFLDQLKAAASAPAGAKAQMQLIGRFIAVSPVAFFNELRESAPIFTAPAFTLVTRAEDVREVLTLNDIFTTDLLRQNMTKFIGNTVVELPPSPEYERRKSVLRLAFPMTDIERYRRILLEESSALLHSLPSAGSFDLAHYAKMLPAKAISRYLGLQALPAEKVVQWMHAINEGAVRNLANVPEVNETAAAASAEVKPEIRRALDQVRSTFALPSPHSAQLTLWDRLAGLFSAAKTKASADPTVLERYLRMQAVEATYTADDDIVSSLLFMMSACVDLTATAITNVVVELCQRPAILDAAIAAAQEETDDEIARYVWEALRFRPPSPGVINTCVQDHVVGRHTDYEQTIKAGTLVMGCSVSAMHDPREVADPTEFRIDRPKSLTNTFFEAGLHTCHGKYFSMVQIPLAVKQLLRAGAPQMIETPTHQGYPAQPVLLSVTKGSV